MKYRIIKKYNDAGKKYYIAQFLHNNEWKYLENDGPLILGGIRSTRFSTCHQAKKALSNKARELAYEGCSEVVAEGEI